MTILFVGDPEDLTSTYLRHRARQRGLEDLVLAEEDLGTRWSFGFDEDDPGAGWLEVEGRRIPFSDVTGASVRLRPDPPTDEDLDPQGQLFWLVQRRAGLEALLECGAFPVVNPLSAGRANASKPYQMGRLAALGMRVPEWVCTNDADAARDFLANCPHGAVVKSASGMRSHVRIVDDEVLADLDGTTVPVLLQRRIEGTDARVHVIDGKTFGCAIDCEGVDYRFEHETAHYRPVEVPDDVAALCHKAARDEHLVLAGIDFRIDPAGTWWCLESNPVPTFLPYEVQVGLPIADAILDWMERKTGCAATLVKNEDAASPAPSTTAPIGPSPILK